MSDETTNTESTETANAETITAAAPAPKPLSRHTRRVYVEHKVYGTCITVGAMVYIAPAGTTFDKKVVYKLAFTQQDGVVRDANGSEWLCAGENGGCGPRCPAALKDKLGKVWHSMSFRERAELLKALAAPAAAPEIAAALNAAAE